MGWERRAWVGQRRRGEAGAAFRGARPVGPGMGLGTRSAAVTAPLGNEGTLGAPARNGTAPAFQERRRPLGPVGRRPRATIQVFRRNGPIPISRNWTIGG